MKRGRSHYKLFYKISLKIRNEFQPRVLTARCSIRGMMKTIKEKTLQIISVYAYISQAIGRFACLRSVTNHWPVMTSFYWVNIFGTGDCTEL